MNLNNHGGFRRQHIKPMLSVNQVVKARKLRELRVPMKKIMSLLECSRTTVSRAINNRHVYHGYTPEGETKVPEKKRYDSWKPVLPTKFATEQDDEANLPKHEAVDYSSHLPVDAEPGRMNKPAGDKANFDQKIYMFPESYNALRTELFNNWPSLWKTVGWPMAFDAITFVEMMDAALDTKTTFDSDKVSSICHKYLNLLRNKRGLSSLSYGSGEILT